MNTVYFIICFTTSPHNDKHSLGWELTWVAEEVEAGKAIKLMVRILYPEFFVTSFRLTGAGYDQIMRKFGICRDFAKVCSNIPLGAIPA